MANDSHRHDTEPAPPDAGEHDHSAAPPSGWQALGQPRKEALHVYLYCSMKGCKNSQAVGFSSLSETYGELLQWLRDGGWGLEVVGTAVEAARCPDCQRALLEHTSKTATAQ